jgi:biopolymer transport protein TolR
VSRFFTEKKSINTLSEVNVIPLVDIVFTLLIIFMIIAPMIHKGVEVRVPESSVGKMMPEHDYHIVSITREGDVWFDNQEVTLETLQEQVRALTPEDTVYIQADTTIAYGNVIEVITYIKEHGIQKVGLVTTPIQQDKQ